MLLCFRYDFTIYSQMSKTLSKVFFPSNDPVLQALRCEGMLTTNNTFHNTPCLAGANAGISMQEPASGKLRDLAFVTGRLLQAWSCVLCWLAGWLAGFGSIMHPQGI